MRFKATLSVVCAPSISEKSSPKCTPEDVLYLSCVFFYSVPGACFVSHTRSTRIDYSCLLPKGLHPWPRVTDIVLTNVGDDLLWMMGFFRYHNSLFDQVWAKNIPKTRPQPPLRDSCAEAWDDRFCGFVCISFLYMPTMVGLVTHCSVLLGTNSDFCVFLWSHQCSKYRLSVFYVVKKQLIRRPIGQLRYLIYT